MVNNNRAVLHISDDPRAIRYAAQCLGEYNPDVVSGVDLAKVLDRLREGTYRVVLLELDGHDRHDERDCNHGLSLLKAIKCQDGAIQVIVLASMIPMITALEAMRAGAEACFLKPFDDAGSVCRAIDRAFKKIDAWWIFLSEVSKRKRDPQRPAATADH